MPSGPPLRCKAQGGWGGSAHSPDPTAQSATQTRRRTRAARHVRGGPSGPDHPGSAGLAGRQTPPRPPRGPPRDAPLHPSRGVRLCLAGRQSLTRLTALRRIVRRSAMGSLRFDRHVRETGDLRSRALRPLGRNGSNASRATQGACPAAKGQSPALIRALRARLSGHGIYRAASHASAACARDDDPIWPPRTMLPGRIVLRRCVRFESVDEHAARERHGRRIRTS